MSWASEAFNALKKIILLEERVSHVADRMDVLGRLMTDMDRRLIRLEARLDTYESLARQRKRPKSLPE